MDSQIHYLYNLYNNRLNNYDELEAFIVQNYNYIFQKIIMKDTNVLEVINYILNHSKNDDLLISLKNDFERELIEYITEKNDLLYFPIRMKYEDLVNYHCLICMDEYKYEKNESILVIKCKKCNKILGHYNCVDKYLYHINLQNLCCDNNFFYQE